MPSRMLRRAMNAPIAAASLLAVLLSISEPAHAETSHVLQDGRTVTVADKTIPCDSPTVQADPRMAISVMAECRDVISGVAGQAFLVVGREAGETSPAEYLASAAAEYWPGDEASLRDQRIKTVQVEFSEVQHEMMCLPAVNAAGTGAAVTCVLSQPKTQFIIEAHSTGPQEAYGVMLMFLTGVMVR